MATPSVLQYPYMTSESYCKGYVEDAVACTPAFNWMLNGKLAQSASVVPTYSQQVITAEGQNRYLDSVTVAAIPQTVVAITLAAAATATFAFPGAYSVTSTTPATATASVTSQVVTVTAVAAGTTTVTVYDRNQKKMATISVTVA